MVKKAVLIAGSFFMLSIPVVQAAGNAAMGEAKAAVCLSCHGPEGNSVAPMWPKLAGQSAAYITKQLMDFKSGARVEPTMTGFVAGLSEKDMEDIGAYFESREIKLGQARNVEMALKGERIYRGGIAKTGVSACMSCHGPTGSGIPPRFPRISGQYAAYNVKQLLRFKSGKRANDSEVMTSIAFRMSEKEIDAVSEYMAGLH